MGAITFNGFLKTVEEFDSIEKEVMKQITAGNLRFTVTQVVMASNDYIISADTSFKENFEKQNILLDKYYHEFSVFDLSENEYKLLTTIKSDIDSIRYYSEMIFAIDNPRISPAVVEYMKIIDHKFGHDINEKTTRIFDGIAQRIQACKTKGEQLKEKQAELIFNLIIAGIIFSIVFMLLIIYKITKPIKSLKSAAETIASGDYTVRPKVKTKDEIASLADSFSLMAESISKAHKKISDSNLLLETIFSTIPSGLMVVGEDGKITTINKRMREIINIGETTLEQRTIQNVLEKVNLSDDCREFILHTKLVKNYECVSIDLQGSQKYFGLTLLPVGLTEKQNLLVADDITGYKQQQKKLEELQQFNQTTLDSLPAYICVLDETGCIININKAWKENAIPDSILLSQVSPGLNYLDSIKNNSGKTNEDALKLKRGIEEVTVGLNDKFDLEYFCSVSEENNWFVVRVRPFEGSEAFPRKVVVSHTNITDRKKAELSLKESEEKYRTVADFTYNWECWQTPEGKFNYVSPSCKRITGYDAEEFINTPNLLLNITHLNDKEILNYHNKTVDKASKEPHPLEFRIIDKDGKEKWISHICQPVYSSDGRYLGRRGSNRDITAQKANEEKILKLTKVVENSPVAIMITDKDTKIEYVNAHFMKQFSFKNNSELIGKTPSILQSGNTSNSVYSNMWEKLNAGNSWKGIIQDKCNEGKLMWLSTSITPIKDKKGEIISYATIYLDITEQLELLEKLENYKELLEEMVEDRTRELKESRETFRALAENSKDVIIRFNNKFQYLYINPAIENFIGMKPEELIGKVHSELPLPKQLIELFDNSLKFVFEVKQNHRVEFQLPNGVWVDWMLFPEFNSIGNVTTVISSSRDITELKKLQLEIQSALEVEKELNKFKDRFISMVSHEFRTPLTSILSSTEILEMGGVALEQKKREKHFNRIKTNIDDLIKMLEEVVYINKFNLGKILIQKESINLKSLCKGIVDEYKELYPGIKTEINFKPEETFYKLDSSIMKKILSNLISNAFKYNNTADAIVKLDIKTKRNNLIFQVTDNGIGIPFEDQKNIFEAFFRSTTTQNIQGTGLGLNIVKKLITQLNGRISLKSEPNIGTQFTIIIPLT